MMSDNQALTIDDIDDSCGYVDLDEIAGRQVDVVQSTLTGGAGLVGFTVRFTDGYLLKVDATETGAIKPQLVDERVYLKPTPERKVKG